MSKSALLNVEAVLKYNIIQSCSVHGISQARIVKWLPFPSAGNLSNPGNEPVSPLLAGRFYC